MDRPELSRLVVSAAPCSLAVAFAMRRSSQQPLPRRLGCQRLRPFANDEVTAKARVPEGLDVTYGITASALGSQLFETFRTLADTGPIADAPVPAQLAAMSQAVGQINDGLKTVRSLHSENGRRLAQVEHLTERAER